MAEPEDDRELSRARLALARARDGRQKGGTVGVELCTEAAAEAHGHALQSLMDTGSHDAAVVMYHAHACVGRLHRYRAEHEHSLPAYRQALAVVEGYGSLAPPLARWLAPAFHDCYVEARLLGHVPPEFGRWAEGRFEDYRGDPNSRLYAFVHDNAYMGADGTATDPHHLYAVAKSGAWYAEDPFEKMVLLASMALAAGRVGNGKWFMGAARLFELTTHELASQEGVALQLLDVAQGAMALDQVETALELLVRARVLASQREEEVVHGRATALIGAIAAERILPDLPRVRGQGEIEVAGIE